MNRQVLTNMGLRYVVLLILGLGNLSFMYAIATPLTVYPVYFILSLFNPVTLVGESLLLPELTIVLVPACIAGAAYYFLLGLSLTTPLNPRQRLPLTLILLCSFLVLNVVRIIVFTFLAQSGFEYFETAHALTWYFGSTLLIVGIWFTVVRLFTIKNIPIATDVGVLLKLINSKKN